MTPPESAPLRSDAITYQQILDADTHPVPDVLRRTSDVHFTDADVPVTRYTSRSFHELEKEKLWSRVWQMACRSEDIPEVGDTHRYDIADRSYLIVRTAPDVIKGYYNACLHRGRMLREHDGRVDEIRCPFHGFCWELDGRLKQVPSGWDFPHVYQRAEEFQLPEVKVDTWGGFVFINPDENCESLASFLGELPDHFADWDLENRYKSAHVRESDPLQLEGGVGGVLRSAPCSCHPSPDLAEHRRRHHPVRRVGQFQSGDISQQHAQPPPALDPDRTADVRRANRPAPGRRSSSGRPRQHDRP